MAGINSILAGVPASSTVASFSPSSPEKFLVADEAKSAGIPTALLSGSVEQSAYPAFEECFDLIISAKPDSLSVEEAMLRAEALLTEVAAAFAERVKCDHSVS